MKVQGKIALCSSEMSREMSRSSARTFFAKFRAKNRENKERNSRILLALLFHNAVEHSSVKMTLLNVSPESKTCRENSSLLTLLASLISWQYRVCESSLVLCGIVGWLTHELLTHVWQASSEFHGWLFRHFFSSVLH